MISDNYRQHAYLILEELFYSLTEQDKINLKIMLKTLKEKKKIGKIEEFMIKYEVQPYIKATVSERKKKKKWNENNYRLALVFFSFKYLYQGYNLLKFVSNLPENGPYRKVVSDYSISSINITKNNDYLKIFDDILEID